MKLMFIFAAAFLVNSIQCFDSESFESSYNGVESSPFYDTIIFSDLADIMKEFESNNIPIFDKLAKDDSESDENIEDLLQEYQIYLEKEQKQRKNYLERTKLKNKVPLLRHERYSKMNFGNGGKYNDYILNNEYYNLDSFKSKNPLDLFIPVNAKVNRFHATDQTTTLPRDSMEINNFKKIVRSDSFPSSSSFTKIPFNVPCCKNGQIPCKQCLTAKDLSRSRLEPNLSMYSDEKKINPENKFPDLINSDDTLNIRIKIDVQLPKIQKLDKHQNNFGVDNGGNTKDYPLGFKMPTSYYNFPIPMNLFGYKSISKINSSPLHKITIHKKKKAKSNTGGKKHKKKVITFHNIKLEPQQIYEAHFGKNNVTESASNENHNNVTSNTTHIIETIISTTPLANDTQTEENIFLLVNISNNVYNDTDESNTTNNSIEAEYTNTIFNVTTENSVHLINKRDVASNMTMPFAAANKTIEKNISVNKTTPPDNILNTTRTLKDSVKKIEKTLPREDELLHWPNNNNESQSKIASKNITTTIIENETKKAELNMTKETMRNNRTRALGKVIFGDVDWNDVDAVVPEFISFIGKYTQGTITLCSDKICHSMKCGQKVCHHRICTPKERFNNKGHCMGANNTDSVATMNSIIDLPSNVGFKIVDILQDKMAGKIFGKATLCISSKCMTFVASKKLFVKTKCTIKELNPKGHCVNLKGLVA